MIHPSYTELINAVNARNDQEEPLVKSRYSIVHAAARRARQIVSGDEPFIETASDQDKPLSVAVEELYEGKVNILPEGTTEEDLHQIHYADLSESDSFDDGEEIIEVNDDEGADTAAVDKYTEEFGVEDTATENGNAEADAKENKDIAEAKADGFDGEPE